MSSRHLFLIGMILFAGLGTIVFAHEEREEAPVSSDIQLAITLRDNAYNVVVVSAIALICLVVYSIKNKPRKERTKKILFLSIVFFALGSNLYLAGATLYTNHVSPTGGPVHWHTDFEVWKCGESLDLVDPTGWDNRVGTWEIHEHNDNRMHIEGTILNMDQGSYHHFFEVIGGNVDTVGMTFPTVNGETLLPKNGSCNNAPAQLQLFRLFITNPGDAKQWIYDQEKLAFPEGLNMIMAPYGNIPPGDCLIIEFDTPKAKTTHSCASYRAAMDRGELHGR